MPAACILLQFCTIPPASSRTPGRARGAACRRRRQHVRPPHAVPGEGPAALNLRLSLSPEPAPAHAPDPAPLFSRTRLALMPPPRVQPRRTWSARPWSGRWTWRRRRRARRWWRASAPACGRGPRTSPPRRSPSVRQNARARARFRPGVYRLTPASALLGGRHLRARHRRGGARGALRQVGAGGQVLARLGVTRAGQTRASASASGRTG